MQDETISGYPLTWPAGWKRAQPQSRKIARFRGRSERSYEISVAEAVERIIQQLDHMGVPNSKVIISTNIPLRIDGWPRSSDQREPADTGAAVYWPDRKGKESRCMAIDIYTRVADNLAAIAATLEAMRAIERHGGAAILDRAFTGFKALPQAEQWWQILGLPGESATRTQIIEAHRARAMEKHPDRGGAEWEMARINDARDRGLKECA